MENFNNQYMEKIQKDILDLMQPKMTRERFGKYQVNTFEELAAK